MAIKPGWADGLMGEKVAKEPHSGMYKMERWEEAVTRWVKETPEGQEWLARMASEVGVPLQTAFQFKEKKNEASG